VQAYLYVKSRRIEGLEGGVYYYHPQRHELVLLTPDVEIAADVHTPNNFYIHDGAAFGLFLIGKLSAIEPLYGEAARDFCLLEAGYIGQLLQTVGFNHNIGLCPVGGVDFDRIRTHFDLDIDHIYLHGLLGGAISEDQKLGFATVEEMNGSSPVAVSSDAGDDTNDFVDTLRRSLTEQLPAYMVPASFVVLDTLPLTRNGKVDRRSLPDPTADATDLKPVCHEVPTTPTEQMIWDVWAEILDTTTFGVEVHFFDDLGGTSLQAIRMVTALRKSVDIPIPITAPYQFPTIRLLAEFLSEQSADSSPSQTDASRSETEVANSAARRQQQPSVEETDGSDHVAESLRRLGL
jgi:SagB-type dehydrogenase family enzyme